MLPYNPFQAVTRDYLYLRCDGNEKTIVECEINSTSDEICSGPAVVKCSQETEPAGAVVAYHVTSSYFCILY